MSEIAVDGETVFVETDEPVKGKPHEQIWRIAKGAEPVQIVDAEKLTVMVAGGHRLYFLRDDKQVVSTNADGKDEKVLGTQSAMLYADAHHVYIATPDGITRVAHEGGASEQVIAGMLALMGGDAQRIFVIAKDTGVSAIDKQTKVKTLVTAARPTTAHMGVGAGTNTLYLVQSKQLVSVPL